MREGTLKKLNCPQYCPPPKKGGDAKLDQEYFESHKLVKRLITPGPKITPIRLTGLSLNRTVCITQPSHASEIDKKFHFSAFSHSEMERRLLKYLHQAKCWYFYSAQ